MTKNKREVLIVAGLGKGGLQGEKKGGVYTFTNEQVNYLSDNYYTNVYNAAPVTRFLFLSTIYSLLSFIRFPFQNRPDVIHINSSSFLDFYRNSFYILYSAYVWNIPIVVRFGGSGFDEFIKTKSILKRIYISIVLSSIDKILVLTELQKTVVCQYVSEDNVVVFRQATEVDKFCPEYDKNPNKLLYLSSLSERKGTPEFCKAIDELLHYDKLDFTVDIAGDGIYRERIEELARNHEQVEYHGYVTGKEKYTLYNNAGVFILPTYSEGFPNVLIEAMAGGNAVITTNASGISEIVGDENGVVINPGNVQELKSAVLGILSSKDKISEIGEHNRELAIEKYSWEGSIKKLDDIYFRVTDDKYD